MNTNLLLPVISGLVLLFCIVSAVYWKFKARVRGEPSGSDTDLARKILLSKIQLEATIDALSDFICVIGKEQIIQRVNKSYAKKVGKPIRSLLGKKCYSVFFGRDKVCGNCPAKEAMLLKAPVQDREYNGGKDEDARSYKIGAFPVYDSEGELVNIIEHIRDITEEKRLNEHVIRSEKLAGIGIMTAGIAHEINNPLSGISGIAENLLNMPEKFGINETGRERVTTIVECAERASSIMQDLLRLSQKQDIFRTVADIKTLVKNSVDGLRMSGLSRIGFEHDFEADLPRVRCDPSRIEQVITNLLTNSVQAINDKSKKCRKDDVQFKGEVNISIRRTGEDVCIEIKDNGIGIPPEAKKRIFDPFFTTRAPGKGTGLGLSICYRIIEEHQGQISVETKRGITTAAVVLPIGSEPILNVSGRLITRRADNAEVQNINS